MGHSLKGWTQWSLWVPSTQNILWFFYGAVIWNEQSLLGNWTSSEHSYQRQKTKRMFHLLTKHCCHTPDLSSAPADEISHPVPAGICAAFPISSASTDCLPTITWPGPSGQKDPPALLHEMCTETLQCPGALISLISYPSAAALPWCHSSRWTECGWCCPVSQGAHSQLEMMSLNTGTTHQVQARIQIKNTTHGLFTVQRLANVSHLKGLESSLGTCRSWKRGWGKGPLL